MISTETLEEIAKNLRHRFNTFTHNEKEALAVLYRGKMELLEELINISKEEEREAENERNDER